MRRASIEINIPDVHAEVTEFFWRYTNAISTNDIDTVKALFWDSEHVLRFGSGENLYGIDAIATYRDGQRGRPIKLEITRLVITTFGRDFATANCELLRSDSGGRGRMSHAWVCVEQGWRIVAAHLSPGP